MRASVLCDHLPGYSQFVATQPFGARSNRRRCGTCIAAYLPPYGVAFRIFGSSMNRWQTQIQRICERDYIAAPVLRGELSVRDWRQSFNGAEEFARFKRNGSYYLNYDLDGPCDRGRRESKCVLIFLSGGRNLLG